MHEMYAELFAAGDDIDPGVFLFLDPDERGVALALRELVAFKAPRSPEFFRFGEPGRLRQRTGDGGFKHQRFLPCGNGFFVFVVPPKFDPTLPKPITRASAPYCNLT